MSFPVSHMVSSIIETDHISHGMSTLTQTRPNELHFWKWLAWSSRVGRTTLPSEGRQGGVPSTSPSPALRLPSPCQAGYGRRVNPNSNNFRGSGAPVFPVGNSIGLREGEVDGEAENQ